MFRGITRSPGHPFEKNPFHKTQDFKVGETFKGTVIQRLNTREFLVAARARQFRAYTALNLVEGQQHRFQVTSLGSKVELKVLDGEVKPQMSPIGEWASSREIRTRLVKILTGLPTLRIPGALSSGAKETLERLIRLLPAVVYHGPEKDTGKWLLRVIQGSGLFWESKVTRNLLGDKKEPWNRILAGDLKGLLLLLDKALTGKEDSDGEMKTLALAVREALHLIEQDQFLNLSALREETTWFLFLPGRREDGFIDAEVFVEKDHGEEGVRFSMVMAFTRLGRLEATAAVTHGVVHVSMLLEDEESAAYVSEHLKHLEKALERCGLKPGRIVCGVGVIEDRGQMPFSENEWTSNPVHLII